MIYFDQSFYVVFYGHTRWYFIIKVIRLYFMILFDGILIPMFQGSIFYDLLVTAFYYQNYKTVFYDLI